MKTERHQSREVLITCVTIAGFTLLVALLLFPGLGNNYFWDDEADTAIFARNILHTGLPGAWDGRNLYGYRDGSLLNADLVNRVSPWLQYYLTAFYFLLLGPTTFAARLPFVMAGLVSVPVLYLLARELTGRKSAAVFACLYFVVSPTVLLFFRQSRYYALVILAVMLLLLGYLRLSREDRKGLFFFTTAGIFFFYSNYFIFIVTFAALVVTHLVCDFKSGRLRDLLTGGVLTLLAGSPYLLYCRPWEVPGAQVYLYDRAQNAFHLFGWYLRDYNLFNFLPALYVLLFVFFFLDRVEDDLYRYRWEWRVEKPAVFLLVFLAAVTGLLALLSPQIWRDTTAADVRYAVGLLPLIAILLGLLTTRIVRWSRLLALATLAGIFLGNLYTLEPLFGSGKVRLHLMGYLYEITHDYRTPYEAVNEYLEKKGRKGDLVLVRPEFCTYPLMFYSGSNFLFGGVLHENNRRILSRQKAKLPEYVYSSEIVPDWIITFGPIRMPVSMVKYLEEQKAAYKMDLIDIYFMDMTRPELRWHGFAPIGNFPAEKGIYVWKLLPADANREKEKKALPVESPEEPANGVDGKSGFVPDPAKQDPAGKEI